MKKILLSLFLFTACICNAQLNRTKVWYFGTNAGIDFNTPLPTVLSNGSVNTFEGVASICDTSGNLLFYTDGVTVWNSNHAAMANGTGLMGYSSSSQSALIVPMPGNDSLYYLFTTYTASYYSIINMNLAGGLGDVVAGSKNIPLLTPSTEKLTGVVHQNGINLWVVMHEWMTDSFYTYEVTPAGINAPVISGIGSVHINVPNMIGCMKLSHNGAKLAVAITYMSTAEIFDFDNATGVISNPISITGQEDPYGVEFSPDNSKLYFASRGPYTTQAVYQFDMNAGSAAAIIASKAYVNQSVNTAINGSIQLGPDGKIYIAHDYVNYLETIDYPNLPAASCGYTAMGLPLLTQSQEGLPNHITSYFSSPATGISEITAEHSSVFPNPAADELKVFIPGSLNGLKIKITVSDISGKKVLEFLNEKQQVIPVNISTLENGIYLLKLENEKQISVVKFVKN